MLVYIQKFTVAKDLEICHAINLDTWSQNDYYLNKL